MAYQMKMVSWISVLTVSYSRLNTLKYFIFMLTVHRNRFPFNNQTDALIIPNLFCHKTIHVSSNFFAHHQEFATVYSALVSFMQVSDERFQAESGWNSMEFHPGSSWKRLSKPA